MTNFISNKTLIIGLGLIGGSIAKALKKQKISQEIWAFDLNYESIEMAKEQQIINGLQILDDDLSDFDLIILCAPLSQYQNIFKKIHNSINPNAIFFDIGSVKNFNFKDIPSNFIPCHPIAGSDKTGYENSDENLLIGKKFIIGKEIKNLNDSPNNSANQSLNQSIILKIINKFGAIPVFLEPNLHDKIYGLVSHLPQFLAFLCAENSPKELPNNFIKKAFRLDKSNPQIWNDIFQFNQRNLEFFYNQFYQNLLELIDDLESENFNQHINDKDFITTNCDQDFFDQKFADFFEKNFINIFSRILIVMSFLKIDEIHKYKKYAGQGFEDFVSIINIIHIKPEMLSKLIIKHKKPVIKLLNNLVN